MRQETINIYKFQELSEESKEKAIERYRNFNLEDSSWSECITEDFAAICDLFGIDCRQTRKNRKDGTYFYTPTIYFSGFWSQGDGASFECKYTYKKGGLKAVEEYAPKDFELHKILKNIQDIQKQNFYRLCVSSNVRGFYVHSGCMSVNIEHNEGHDVSRDTEESMTQAFRDLADWLYSKLESEWDFQNSDEYISEQIIANDYEFNADGSIY